MRKQEGCLISAVAPGSPAASAGVAPGDRLLLLDRRPVRDIIDYKIMEADRRVELLLRKKDGHLQRLRITKEEDTPLGLQFQPPTMAPVRRCRNRCLFCFVDQNPPGLRRALYLKDDDYRLSFLYGNFITLNNLSEADMERIVKLRLSPLYVSVHSTDPVVRRRLFGTPRAASGLRNLHRLLQQGIQVHAQVVLCPGINTGPQLEKTVRDLASMGTGVLSIALVPVGLTRYRRETDEPLRRVTPSEAAEIVAAAENWQRRFRAERGSRLVFPADELYRLAGADYPDAASYEGYPQLENGVGLARIFLDELARVKITLPGELKRPVSAAVATGREAAPLLEELVKAFSEIRGLDLRLRVIENRFFGPTVTVAGLLTGADLMEGLSGADLGEVLFISPALLREGTDLFLDGVSVGQLQEALGVTLRPVGGPQELAEYLQSLALQAREGKIH